MTWPRCRKLDLTNPHQFGGATIYAACLRYRWHLGSHGFVRTRYIATQETDGSRDD